MTSLRKCADSVTKTFGKATYVVSAILIFLGGCTTDWIVEGSYYRTTQTLLEVQSSPPGKILINGSQKGESPSSIPLEYEREVQRKTRKVSYWISQPGLALGITLLSLGLYLPFSAIPVDVELRQEPQSTFRSNQFLVQVQADEYQPWENVVVCTGQDRLVLNPTLTRRE
jgi:hypothetical protein